MSMQSAETWNAENGYFMMPETSNNVIAEEKTSLPSLKQPFADILQAEDGLKKMDSFNRWMSKELADVSEIHIHSGGAYWDSVEGETGIDSGISPQELENTFSLSPSLSQDQLFSIMDFSPNWGYANSEIKVLTHLFSRILIYSSSCLNICSLYKHGMPVLFCIRSLVYLKQVLQFVTNMM